MSMFIETTSGRLQNLYLLQDIRVVEEDSEKYSVGYIQSNGAVIVDETFDTLSEAEARVNEIKSSLIGGN